MAWSKVSKEHRKPCASTIAKVFCEWGWFVRNRDNSETYYHHLKMCLVYGYNLYGEKIK